RDVRRDESTTAGVSGPDLPDRGCAVSGMPISVNRVTNLWDIWCRSGRSDRRPVVDEMGYA
ncbi:hypothetical protein, partial [Embleya sp. NPDC005971]|uniref:hypothetical protein n=1 Tax=Embleya sp. NPDC005971 TaxID=3156724 RepID=UPI0033CC8247